jgi:hypothetical protein
LGRGVAAEDITAPTPPWKLREVFITANNFQQAPSIASGHITLVMANAAKTYFIVPTWDFPVRSIKLGNLIADPNRPQSILRAAEAADLDTPTYPSDKYDFTQKIGATKKGKYGLFARFCQVVGIGAEASVHHDEKRTEEYSFEHMHTEWFVPSEELVKKACTVPRVVDYLEQMNFETPVYMVTGVKTVEGASVTTDRSKGRGFFALFGVDGTPAGIPLSLGSEASHDSDGTVFATFKNSSHIVFAFQLREIRCKEGKINSNKEYLDGALFGVDKSSWGPEMTIASVEMTKEVMQQSLGESVVESVVESFDEGGNEDCYTVVPSPLPTIS